MDREYRIVHHPFSHYRVEQKVEELWTLLLRNGQFVYNDKALGQTAIFDNLEDARLFLAWVRETQPLVVQ